MNIIILIILMTFLLSQPVYSSPLQSVDTLRVPLTASETSDGTRDASKDGTPIANVSRTRYVLHRIFSGLLSVRNLLERDSSKRRENKLNRERKHLSMSWGSGMRALEDLAHFMRESSLRTDFAYYTGEWLENLDVHIIQIAEARGFIRDEEPEAFLDLPIGLRLPLIKLEGRGRETLLRNAYDDGYYYMKYDLDSEKIEAMFEGITLSGLKLDDRRWGGWTGARRKAVGGRQGGVWQEAFIMAALHDKTTPKRLAVQEARDRIIDIAINLESMNTGVDKATIRTQYDIYMLVRNWLERLGVNIGEVNIINAGPLAILQPEVPRLMFERPEVFTSL